MARYCQITGKNGLVGNNVSFSHKKTKKESQPNLFDKKFYLPEEERWVKLRVSKKGMRIIDKKGLKSALKEAKNKGFIKDY